MKKAFILCLEGMDKSGKSSARACIEQFARDNHLKLACFRDPGSTPLAESIRSIFHKNHTIDPIQEILLFTAARRDMVQAIEKVLYQYDLILLDRFYFSSIAYQAFGREIDMALIEKLITLAVPKDFHLDLTLFLEISMETFSSRMQAGYDKNDHFEKDNHLDFWERVHTGYAKIMKESKQSVVTIDSNKDMHQVHQNIEEILYSKISTS